MAGGVRDRGGVVVTTNPGVENVVAAAPGPAAGDPDRQPGSFSMPRRGTEPDFLRDADRRLAVPGVFHAGASGVLQPLILGMSWRFSRRCRRGNATPVLCCSCCAASTGQAGVSSALWLRSMTDAAWSIKPGVAATRSVVISLAGVATIPMLAIAAAALQGRDFLIHGCRPEQSHRNAAIPPFSRELRSIPGFAISARISAGLLADEIVGVPMARTGSASIRRSTTTRRQRHQGGRRRVSRFIGCRTTSGSESDEG